MPRRHAIARPASMRRKKSSIGCSPKMVCSFRFLCMPAASTVYAVSWYGSRVQRTRASLGVRVGAGSQQQFESTDRRRNRLHVHQTHDMGCTSGTAVEELHLASGCQCRRIQAEEGDGDISAPAVREPGVTLHNRAAVKELRTTHMQVPFMAKSAMLLRDGDGL